MVHVYRIFVHIMFIEVAKLTNLTPCIFIFFFLPEEDLTDIQSVLILFSAYLKLFLIISILFLLLQHP